MPDFYPPNHSGYFIRPPKSAKTASSPRDALIPSKGGSERPKIILPSLFVYVVPRIARTGPLTAHNALAHPLADTFYPPHPPIASHSISRHVP
jgi:hypothetical protein